MTASSPWMSPSVTSLDTTTWSINERWLVPPNEIAPGSSPEASSAVRANRWGVSCSGARTSFVRSSLKSPPSRLVPAQQVVDDGGHQDALVLPRPVRLGEARVVRTRSASRHANPEHPALQGASASRPSR